MGISYNNGTLPFIITHSKIDKLNKEINELYDIHQQEFVKINGNTKNFQTNSFPFKNGWSLTHYGPTINNIAMFFTLTKNDKTVHGTSLNDGCDYLVMSNNENHLKEFISDFKIKTTIHKKCHLTQTL